MFYLPVGWQMVERRKERMNKTPSKKQVRTTLEKQNPHWF